MGTDNQYTAPYQGETYLFALLPTSGVPNGTILFTSDEGYCQYNSTSGTWAQYYPVPSPLPGAYPAAASLTGSESVEVQQGNVAVSTSTQAIANLNSGVLASTLPSASALAGTEPVAVTQGNASKQTTASAIAKIAVEPSLGSATALGGTELFRCYQGTGIVTATAAQISAYAGGGASGFKTSPQTSTYVIANYPPASNGGASIRTSDMGLMYCDGVRWKVIGTPPIPLGAAMLGYSKNVYTRFPVLSEIVMSRGTTQSDFYAGLAPDSNQPVSGTFATDATTGQLAMYWNSGGSAKLTTVKSQNVSTLTGCLGNLPPAIGSKGWHYEAAYTIPTDGTNVGFNAFYVQPWQHNANKPDRPGGTLPTNYEEWDEYDINEQGHGTDQAGFHRGTYICWGGSSSPGMPITFSPAPTGGTNTGVLASPWTGETTSAWNITMGTTGQQIGGCTLTNGSTAVTFGANLSGTPTTAATVYTFNIDVQTAQTTSLSYTTEHIFAGTYDPVGQNFYVYLDGVLVETISTANSNINRTYRDSLGYVPIIQCANLSGQTYPQTILLRYLSLWTP